MHDAEALKVFIETSGLDEKTQKALHELLLLELRDAPITDYSNLIQKLAAE